MAAFHLEVILDVAGMPGGDVIALLAKLVELGAIEPRALVEAHIWKVSERLHRLV
jgi:hypothetical protein